MRREDGAHRAGAWNPPRSGAVLTKGAWEGKAGGKNREPWDLATKDLLRNAVAVGFVLEAKQEQHEITGKFRTLSLGSTGSKTRQGKRRQGGQYLDTAPVTSV